jgi:CheY-like chemotaxis protein
MGGRLSRDAEADGLALTLELPAAPAAKPADRQRRQGDGLRALLVEDDPISREAAALALGATGLDVAEAKSAEAAQGLLDEGAFDLVLLDMELPGGAAPALLARLRSGHAAATPVLAMTAEAGALARRRLREAGADAFIAKPFEVEALQEAALGLAASGRPEPAEAAEAGGGMAAEDEAVEPPAWIDLDGGGDGDDGDAAAAAPAPAAEPAPAAAPDAPAEAEEEPGGFAPLGLDLGSLTASEDEAEAPEKTGA